MIIGVTGHRPDKLRRHAGMRDVSNAALVAFCEVILPLKPTLVITGLAQGWDTHVALACRASQVLYIGAIPFETQAARWPEDARQRYEILVRDARAVEIVCPGRSDAAAYQTRNEWIVDRCDVLVTLWDGSDGGTANCLRYAEKVGRRIVPAWESFVKGLENG